MKIRVVLVILALAAYSGTAQADLYRFIDNVGGIHFVDDIAKVPEKYRTQLKEAGPQGNVNVINAAPAANSTRRSTAQEPQQATSSDSAQVEVFLTSWCGYCKKMVQFLNEKGIPYTAYDIEKDATAASRYRELGGNGVPVVRVGTHVIHGYNPGMFMSYYNGGK